MTRPQTDIPVRAPAQTSADDTVQPFDVSALDLRGRVVRLGSAVDGILSPHNYPPPVAKLLGEAVALTVLLGSALKIEGRFILQTQTDGPVRMLGVDFRSPGNGRACARFDAGRVVGAIEAAPRLQAPVLILAGRFDNDFANEARRLYSAAGSADKEIRILERGEHGTDLVGSSLAARRLIDGFFATH